MNFPNLQINWLWETTFCNRSNKHCQTWKSNLDIIYHESFKNRNAILSNVNQSREAESVYSSKRPPCGFLTWIIDRSILFMCRMQMVPRCWCNYGHRYTCLGQGCRGVLQKKQFDRNQTGHLAPPPRHGRLCHSSNTYTCARWIRKSNPACTWLWIEIVDSLFKNYW